MSNHHLDQIEVTLRDDNIVARILVFDRNHIQQINNLDAYERHLEQVSDSIDCRDYTQSTFQSYIISVCSSLLLRQPTIAMRFADYFYFVVRRALCIA